MKHANSETLCTVLSLFSVPDGQNVAHVYPYTQIWCCLDELSVHASSRCCYAILICCIVMDACLVQRANRHMPGQFDDALTSSRMVASRWAYSLSMFVLGP